MTTAIRELDRPQAEALLADILGHDTVGTFEKRLRDAIIKVTTDAIAVLPAKRPTAEVMADLTVLSARVHMVLTACCMAYNDAERAVALVGRHEQPYEPALASAVENLRAGYNDANELLAEWRQ